MTVKGKKKRQWFRFVTLSGSFCYVWRSYDGRSVSSYGFVSLCLLNQWINYESARSQHALVRTVILESYLQNRLPFLKDSERLIILLYIKETTPYRVLLSHPPLHTHNYFSHTSPNPPQKRVKSAPIKISKKKKTRRIADSPHPHPHPH